MTEIKFKSVLDKGYDIFKGDNSIFDRALFPKIKKATYDKNKLYLGKKFNMYWDKDKKRWRSSWKGFPYYIDVSKSKRYLTLGAAGCMPKGTLIKTPQGILKIEDIDTTLVYSYNFDTHQIEEKEAYLTPSGHKKIVKIHTEEGIIECSEEHKWIIFRDSKIQVIEAKYLKDTDLLLKVE